VPTKRRRHAITETPDVEAALAELRDALGEERVKMGELVVLGANAKLAELRAEREDVKRRRSWITDRIRNGEPLADLAAAEEVRRSAWVRW